jgi:hypothetical protein
MKAAAKLVVIIALAISTAVAIAQNAQRGSAADMQAWLKENGR